MLYVPIYKVHLKLTCFYGMIAWGPKRPCRMWLYNQFADPRKENDGSIPIGVRRRIVCLESLDSLAQVKCHPGHTQPPPQPTHHVNGVLVAMPLIKLFL